MAENEQNNFGKKVGEELKKGAKKQAKNATKEIVKKILKFLAPILLKLFIIIVVAIIIMQALSWVLDLFSSTKSKEATKTSIIYSFVPSDEEDEESEENGGYRVIVKLDSGKKAYKLEYQFNEEDGTEIAEDKVIESIKEALKDEDLDASQFTESELKILAVLKENGLDIEDYKEEELQCFALFIKAEIASQCFDLRDKDHLGEEVDVEEIRKNDYVYGTLRAQKVTATGGADAGTIEENLPVITPEILNGLNLESRNGWTYYMKTPDEVDEEEKLPLILFLSGEGDKVLERFVRDIPQLAISQSVSSGAAFESGNFIYAVPYIDYDQQGTVLSNVRSFINYMVSNYNVDEERIILTGCSTGGSYTWYFINQNPTLLAGAVVFSCGAGVNEDNIANYLRTPIWGIAGDRTDQWGNDDLSRYYSMSGSISKIRSRIINKDNAKMTQLTPCDHSQSLHVFFDDEYNIYKDIVTRKEIFDWMLSKNRTTNLEETENLDEDFIEIEEEYTDTINRTRGHYEIKELTFKEYDSFMNMISQNNISAENYFTIDKDEKFITATWSKSNTEVKYLDEEGKELSEEDMGKIPEGNIRESTGNTMVYTTTPVAYKNHVTKYGLTYGLLSDILIITNNTDFCTELTALAFNSKIVLSLREETTFGNSYTKVNYTKKDIICKTVDYEVNGEKITPVPDTKNTFYSGQASSLSDIKPNYQGTDYGWRQVDKSKPSYEDDEKIIFIWNYNNQDYELEYNKGKSYRISKIIHNSPIHTPYDTMSGESELIEKGTDEEFKEYNGGYTYEDVFKYVVETTTTSTNHSYKYLDISEIDTWYAKYKKEYNGSPEREAKSSGSGPKEKKGEFEKTEEEIIESSETILADTDVEKLIEEKEDAYIKIYPDAENVECIVSKLVIENWDKEDRVSFSSSSSTSYRFPEDEADTTDIKLKNVEIVDDKQQYTDKNGTEKGFLYLYDKYVTKEDIFLAQDAERELFTLLDEDQNTKKYTSILKLLLYAYDGIDRDIDDLDLTYLQVRPIGIRTGSLQMLTHTKITKEEFIEAVQGYRAAREGTEDFKEGADIIYDVCVANNINPVWCVAQAWKEQGWKNPGKGVANYNFWGIGVFNGQKTGFNYDGGMEDGVQHYCDQINNQLYGSLRSTYQSLAKQYATVRPDKYKGDMSTIYDVFSAYCALDNADTHTLQENADHAVQYLDDIVKIAKNIFGDDIFGLYGSLVEAAYAVGDHFLNSGVLVHYAGDPVDGATNNGRTCIWGDIQKAYDLPIENPEDYGVVCATFVSLALWQSGLIDEETVNKYNYNYTGGVTSIVTDPAYSSSWEKIIDFDDLEDGDIVQTEGHVWIYIEGCKCLDQSYCVRNSANTAGPGRAPYNASNYRYNFIEAYRYVGM